MLKIGKKFGWNNQNNDFNYSELINFNKLTKISEPTDNTIASTKTYLVFFSENERSRRDLGSVSKDEYNEIE